jgi:hypothetical protein
MTLNEIIEDTCRKQTERHLSEVFGKSVKMTRGQHRAYVKAMARIDAENELEAAVHLLRCAGYIVTPPSTPAHP